MDIFEARLGRRAFLGLGLGTAAGILAACSGNGEEAGAPEAEPPAEPPAAPPAESAPPPAATGAAPPPAEPAPPEPPPIEEEDAGLVVLEWAGYEHPTMGGLKAYVEAYGVPEYSFLTSDDQALGRVRAGFKPDLVHPCVSYIRDWLEIDFVQPFDPALLANFASLNPSLAQAAQLDGLQYMIPADWGFASVLYRADKVEPDGGESWTLLYDDRYAGKITWWDSPVENFVIWGYVNGVDDPWNLSDAELAEATRFLSEKKKVCRNFWSSYTDLDADFANGNVWIGYAWQDAWLTARGNGQDVAYADPKEGRLGWLCGFVLAKETQRIRHAHAYVDTWIGKPAARWLIKNYAYGHANTSIDPNALDPNLVAAFRLDDVTALDEPRTHLERFVPNRRAYAKAWSQVKAA